MLGFTKDEINQNFDEIIPKILQKAEKSYDRFWNDLERYYNGYLPNPYATTSIYNPYSIQRFFSDETGELTPFFANSGSTSQLFLILRGLSLEKLNQFLQFFINENYLIPIDKDQMIKKKEWYVFLNDIYQIAFDSGHLTYTSENGKHFLKVPNQEMRIDFENMVKSYLICDGDDSTYQIMIENLKNLNFQNFFINLEKITFTTGSILNLKRRKEGITEQLNYEVFLHQACSIAIKEMLIVSKQRKNIIDFEFLNEKSPAEGIYFFLLLNIILSFCKKY